MLILKLRYDDAYFLFEGERQLGKVVRMVCNDHSEKSPNGVNIGFDFPDSIRIIRQSKISGGNTDGNITKQF